MQSAATTYLSRVVGNAAHIRIPRLRVKSLFAGETEVFDPFN